MVNMKFISLREKNKMLPLYQLKVVIDFLSDLHK